MKRIFFILLFFWSTGLLAQQAKKFIKNGNDQYKQRNYTEAEANYRKAAELNAKNPDGDFNLGDALYKQKRYADANEYFSKIGASSTNKALTAGAYHNLGNSYLESKKLEESIKAYEKSLINNPNDNQTRYNLAYAQEMLKKQNQQKQQNKNNKDQQNKNKQNQQNKDQQNKDNKNQDNKNQPKNNKDQQDKQQQPDQLSKDDAERMLDAMNNDEKQTQDKLKNKKLQGAKMRVMKDW